MSQQRRYARRLPFGYSRTSVLTLRLTPEMKVALAALAAERSMSVCEYAARAISDHLCATLGR